jgi:hypothetical protein
MEWDHMTCLRKKRFKSALSDEETYLHSFGMKKSVVVVAVVNFLNAIFERMVGFVKFVPQEKSQKCYCSVTMPGSTQVCALWS